MERLAASVIVAAGHLEGLFAITRDFGRGRSILRGYYAIFWRFSRSLPHLPTSPPSDSTSRRGGTGVGVGMP